jgi:hypothetical protein
LETNEPVVRPEDLEDWARKGLVFRCLQHRTKPTRARPKGIRSTTILGWSIRKAEGTRADLCEIRYEYTSPSQQPTNILTVTQLGSDTIVWYDHFAELISGWKESTPGWLIGEPQVAVRRGSTAEKKVPFSSLGLFEHYCYLRQMVAQEIEEQTEAKEDLVLVHDRLEAVNDGIVEDWDNLLEQMHV